MVMSPAVAEPGAVQPATEMLQDGRDAAQDDDVPLARQLFEELIKAYPDSSETELAIQELKKLDGMSRSPPQTGAADPTLVAELRRRFVTDAGDRVFFAENSAVLGARARVVLEQQARWLKRRPNLMVTVIGRADDGPAMDAAVQLSQQRADVVRERLIAQGIVAGRISVDARGNRDPVATCETAQCRVHNRHSETLISDPRQARDIGSSVASQP